MTARPERDTFDDVPLSALLRVSRGTYRQAIQRAQRRIGCDDIPSMGEYLLSAMEWSGASLEAVIGWLGVSKQAVSQAVDTLVVRGYLERSQDPSDRRRVKLSLTARGHAAGRAARTAIEEVDRKLRARVGPRKIAQARSVLVALLEIKNEGRDPGGDAGG